MAAVITSQDASERFVESPHDFGGEFALVPSEIAMLVEMGDDLTSLTAAFVNKRRTTLRWNARRTLELLGDEGEEVLDDFIEENPQTDSFRNDAASFGDFVVARTAMRPGKLVVDRIIAEMARFERHRSDSFWNAATGVGDRARSASASDGLEHSEAVVLVAGANIGQFSLDLRLPYRRTVTPWYLLPPDPCHLLFFHSHQRAQLRTIRLRPAAAEVLRSVLVGQPTSIRSMRDSAPDVVDVDRLLRTLSWAEAIEWA
jgi:hypothetical protein